MTVINIGRIYDNVDIRQVYNKLQRLNLHGQLILFANSHAHIFTI